MPKEPVSAVTTSQAKEPTPTEQPISSDPAIGSLIGILIRYVSN